MAWTYEAYNDAVADELSNLIPEHKARLVHIRKLIEANGPSLGLPHTDSFGGGLFEMRLKGPDTIGRVLYCYLDGQRIVFLLTFVKKQQKTPQTHIQTARERMADVKQKDRAAQAAAEEEKKSAKRK